MSPSHRLSDDASAPGPDPLPTLAADVDGPDRLGSVPHGGSVWEQTPPRGPVLRWRPALLAVTVLFVAAAAWWAVAWLTSPAPPSALAAAATPADGPATAEPTAVPTVSVGDGKEAVPSAAATAAETSESAVVPLMRVHVVGEVARPGVVSLAPGSRVADAVRAAGGATRQARADRINLAAPLADGQQVLVPSAHTPEEALERVGSAAEAGPAAAPTTAPSGPDGGPDGTGPGGTVDLNTADAVALQTLPGVGPATAEKIIIHRETVGPFTGLQDLDAVPGIGPATLDRLRDHVTW